MTNSWSDPTDCRHCSRIDWHTTTASIRSSWNCRRSCPALRPERDPSGSRDMQRPASPTALSMTAGDADMSGGSSDAVLNDLVERAEQAAAAASRNDDSRPLSPPSCSKAMAKTLRRATGALALIVEFCRDEMLLHSDVADISRVCREGKCAGISVLADGVEDGFLDLEAFIKDQRKAEGKFPGPCAVISGSPVSSARGVAVAAAAGATAVTLAAPSKGRDEGDTGKALKGILAACAALELDAICEVRDAYHVHEVINAGCKIISVRCVESIAEAENVLSLIASLAGDDVIRIVGVPAMQRGCEEVLQCAQLRAAGADAIVLELAARDADQDADYVKWALANIGGKKSSKFSFLTSTGAEEEKREARWSREYRERQPDEWSKWEKYRKTRDYQIRAQIWGA